MSVQNLSKLYEIYINFNISSIKIYEKDITSNSFNITIGKYYDRINMYELMDKYIKSNPLIEKIQGFQQ